MRQGETNCKCVTVSSCDKKAKGRKRPNRLRDKKRENVNYRDVLHLIICIPSLLIPLVIYIYVYSSISQLLAEIPSFMNMCNISFFLFKSKSIAKQTLQITLPIWVSVLALPQLPLFQRVLWIRISFDDSWSLIKY